jgi:hypothetical protein
MSEYKTWKKHIPREEDYLEHEGFQGNCFLDNHDEDDDIENKKGFEIL